MSQNLQNTALTQRFQPVAIVGPFQDPGGCWFLPSKHSGGSSPAIMDTNKLSPTFAQKKAEVKLNAMP
ncbi:hypothetical protein C0J52_02998 [Blattella germanica]|nr:hypothetical protein C0J52_02998 [Blattella germanica]